MALVLIFFLLVMSMIAIVCTLPFEYCDFGGSPSKCKSNLQETNPELYAKYYESAGTNSHSLVTEHDASDTIATAIMTTTDGLSESLERTKLESDLANAQLAKAMLKEEAKAEKERKRKEALRVKIKAVQRQSKKMVTVVNGVQHFGLELKKITKMFANKFACGSSVVKSASNEDEVVIQGEVLEDAKDFLISEFPDLFNDQNVMIEEKKKK